MAYGYQYPNYYQPQSGLIWVQGEAAAKGYLVAPNSSVALWDSEAQTVYIKSADASGLPSLKVLDYTIRNASNLPQNGPLGDGLDKPSFATKADLRAISSEIEALKEKLSRMEAESL